MNFEDRFIARLFSAAALIGTASAVIPATAMATNSLNRDVSVPARATDGDVGSVNGSVDIGADARVDTVSSVNGGIRLGAGAQVEQLETVNGGIDAAARVVVRDDVQSVNGAVSFDTGAQVNGDVQTVNGPVRFDQAQIAGSVTTVNGPIELRQTGVNGGLETVWGSIELSAGATVAGDITLRKPNGTQNGKPRIPKIVLGPGVNVRGRIVLEHPAEVLVHDSATFGGIEGGQVQRFSGEIPTS